MDYYISVLKKYAVFNGRARRKEYWMFYLFNFIVAVVLAIIESLLKIGGVLSTIYSLAVLLPGIGVTIRRLHDTGRKGWWCLLAFIPLVGTIWLIVLLCLDSESGSNEYGENPKAVY